jgi:hypothetical protein
MRINSFFAIAALICAVPLASCATMGTVLSADTEKIQIKSAQALQLANRFYITTNGIVAAAIRNDVIKGEAALAEVADLDKKINDLLDQATQARTEAQRGVFVKEAIELMFKLEAKAKRKE